MKKNQYVMFDSPSILRKHWEYFSEPLQFLHSSHTKKFFFKEKNIRADFQCRITGSALAYQALFYLFQGREYEGGF